MGKWWPDRTPVMEEEELSLYDVVMKLYPDADHPVRLHLSERPELDWRRGSRLTLGGWCDRFFTRLYHAMDPSPVLIMIRDDLCKLVEVK
jgi:hypothetical protein